MSARIFSQAEADLTVLKGQTVAVIGYGNQGRAQALNLRDCRMQVIIGNRNDDYREQAAADGFGAFDISTATAKADIIFLLIPDEILPKVFRGEIDPNLKPNATLVFASGYNVAFDQIKLPPNNDVLLIAPRMIGIGVRERFLTKEGFFCLVGVHQDANGQAEEKLIALTAAVSGLFKPAIEVTFKQEAILDLFNEQAFGPAFGRVLLTSISILLENGLPPEAVLTEMYLSEEMAYTYQKMAQVGLVHQTLFHSPTSQYGAMSRGIRFMDMGLKPKMRKIYGEIDSGAFAQEWQHPFTRLKFKAIRWFAMRQKINSIERKVRQVLGLRGLSPYELEGDTREILNNPKIRAELQKFEDGFEF